jgi:glycosyltransferase involved in cell wall biosynthesis
MSYCSRKTRKNRILMLSYDLPPKFLWGVANHIAALYKSLHKDFVIDIASKYHESNNKLSNISTDGLIDNHLLVNRFRKKETYKDFELLMTWNLNLARRIKEYYSGKTKPSLVHCHSWLVMPASKKIALYYKVPLVYTAHFLEKQYEGMKDIPTLSDFDDIVALENDFFSCCDAIVVFGKRYKNFLIKNYNGVKKEKIYIIPHGVEKKENNRIQKENIILFVGRLVEEKGIFVFLEAAKKLRELDYKFVVIGTGSLERALRTKYNYGNIVFKGLLSRNTLYKEYLKSKIYCSLSSIETFGLTKVEAALARNVIVTTDGPRIEKIFPSEIIFSIPPNNAKKLIETLLKIVKSNKLISEKSNLIYKFAKENYSIEKMIVKIKKMYLDILGKSYLRK